MKDSDYIIVGDTEQYDGCLIYSCGKNKKSAENILNRILTSPTESDKQLIKRYKNLRIKETPAEDCWWRYE